MALPTIATPIYTIEIPSTKQQFKFRPFTVRDEKALLIAQESSDVGVMLDTVKEVIASCAKTPIEVEKLASFDIEYIFLQIRAKSIGEVVELLFECDEDHGADNDKAIARVPLNLESVKVEFFQGNDNKIGLFDDVGIVMKYPSFATLKKIETLEPGDIDTEFEVVLDCIDFIYDNNEVHPAREQKREELMKFLEELTTEQFDKIRQYFNTLPKLRAYIDYTCPLCQKQHKKYMEGLASFF